MERRAIDLESILSAHREFSNKFNDLDDSKDTHFNIDMLTDLENKIQYQKKVFDESCFYVSMDIFDKWKETPFLPDDEGQHSFIYMNGFKIYCSEYLPKNTIVATGELADELKKDRIDSQSCDPHSIRIDECLGG